MIYPTRYPKCPVKDDSAQPDHTAEVSKKADLIERQAAIDAIVNTVSEIGLHDNSEVARYGATFRQHEIIDIIDGLPSAQPEIIRCKDCKHWDGVDTCDVIDAPVWDNDFCSMAERRSDEE